MEPTTLPYYTVGKSIAHFLGKRSKTINHLLNAHNNDPILRVP